MKYKKGDWVVSKVSYTITKRPDGEMVVRQSPSTPLKIDDIHLFSYTTSNPVYQLHVFVNGVDFMFYNYEVRPATPEEIKKADFLSRFVSN